MKRVAARIVAVFFLTLGGGPVCADSGGGVQASTRVFLNAYAAGDLHTVMSLVDAGVVIYGSDQAEIARGKRALASQLAGDVRLWGGSARIGTMHDISIAHDDRLAAIFFDAPFTVAGRPPVTVRFAMVWRHEVAGWRIVQASNVVPTSGQSAAVLLQRAH